MALLTRANLRTEQAKAGAIVAGLIGLLGIFITNIDKIMDAYRYFVEEHEATELRGSWLGVFREYDSEKKDYITSTESIFVTPSRWRDAITGTADATVPVVRHHEFAGDIKNGFLIAEYREEKLDRGGAVIYMLKGVAASGTLVGFWTGYDPEERALMSCPYVLTRNTNPVWVQSEFKAWLNKACAR